MASKKTKVPNFTPPKPGGAKPKAAAPAAKATVPQGTTKLDMLKRKQKDVQDEEMSTADVSKDDVLEEAAGSKQKKWEKLSHEYANTIRGFEAKVKQHIGKEEFNALIQQFHGLASDVRSVFSNASPAGQAYAQLFLSMPSWWMFVRGSGMAPHTAGDAQDDFASGRGFLDFLKPMPHIPGFF